MNHLTKKALSHLPCVVLACLLGCGTSAARAQDQGTQSSIADINGARIAYTITGASGPTIVLIHGNLFEKQRRALSAASYRVITVDLRGFGDSTAPDDQGSIDLYVDDVLALLDRLGVSQAIIGGHSMGGAITLRLYQRAPGRFLGMILNDAAALAPPIVEQFMWRGYQEQTRQLDPSSVVPLLLPEFLTGLTRSTRPTLVTKVTNQILAASRNGLVGGAHALETRPDLRGVFGNITVPTLILEGEEDSLTPMEQAVGLNRAIASSTLTIIPGASHGVIREAAAASNAAILDWLARNF